jgi:hypothetical protein
MTRTDITSPPPITVPVLTRPHFNESGLATGDYGAWLAANHTRLICWYDDCIRADGQSPPLSWSNVFEFPTFCASQFDMALRTFNNR